MLQFKKKMVIGAICMGLISAFFGTLSEHQQDGPFEVNHQQNGGLTGNARETIFEKQPHSGRERNLTQLRGDSINMRKRIGAMPINERLMFLRGEFLETELGQSKRDEYIGKSKIIEEFGGEYAPDIKNKLLARMGRNLNGNEDQDLVDMLDSDSWRVLISSASQHDAESAFEMAALNSNFSHRNSGCSLTMSIWMETDSIAASEYVAKMPEGELKDAAISEIVKWLKSRNCIEDAKRWGEIISNPDLKAKALGDAVVEN